MIKSLHKCLSLLFLAFLPATEMSGQIMTSAVPRRDSVGVYLDKNKIQQFIYKSSVWVTRDAEKMLPPIVEYTLPEPQVHWSLVNSSELALYFPRKQVILIFTSLFEPKFGVHDTVYKPSPEELDNVVHDRFYSVGPRRYDVTKIPIKQNRTHFMVNKGSVRIVFFNILPQNIDHYLKSSESLILRKQ